MDITAAPADAVSAPPAEPPPLAPAEPPVPEHPFRFHGQAGEFFRIWIVNTLLTLLTLGIFFPWAKLQKRRYVRGCTEFLGHRFEYRANPLGLLIGHLLVVLLFLGYSVLGAVYPFVRWGTLVVVVALLPWIVVRSLAFNAHNTVYRGMRFRFNPSLSAAFLVYLAEWLLIIVTIGLYYPAWARSKRRYIVSNHRLGSAYFHFDGDAGRFYRAMFFGGGIMFIATLLGGLVTTLFRQPNAQPFGLLQLLPFFAIYGLGFFASRHFIHAELFNHIWNHTRLDEHRFRATMKTGRWLGLQFTNLGAILISGGLLYPWALIRSQTYTASCLSLVPKGPPLDTIERVGSSQGSATGDSAAEFVGLDFGL